MRDLRRGTYYAVLNEEEDIDKAATVVEDLFNHLFIAYNL
jgi:type I restriction enzyme R subunit